MSEIRKRVTSTTPKFFKKMRPWAYFIAAMAASVARVTGGIPQIPLWVSLVFAGMGTIAGTAAAFTYLPKEEE